jgi:hypothetical protein
MEDGQSLLQWYATTLLYSLLIAGGSVGRLWNGTWMIMTTILFIFPISLPSQCSSSQLSSLSRHIEIMISNILLFFYADDFRSIDYIVHAERKLHSEWGVVKIILSWNSVGVLYEVKHPHLWEDHIISTFAREVSYCYIVVCCTSTPMFRP